MNMQRREVLGVLTVAAGSGLLPGSLPAAAAQTPAPNNLPTERVTGIGGVFFRAHDPKALAQWYQDHLGVTCQVWSQEAGPPAFTPFAEKTNYFGDSTKHWMINFRVGDLDKMARHRGQGEPHDISKRRSLCTHSRYGREPNRVVAAHENG